MVRAERQNPESLPGYSQLMYLKKADHGFTIYIEDLTPDIVDNSGSFWFEMTLPDRRSVLGNIKEKACFRDREHDPFDFKRLKSIGDLGLDEKSRAMYTKLIQISNDLKISVKNILESSIQRQKFISGVVEAFSLEK